MALYEFDSKNIYKVNAIDNNGYHTDKIEDIGSGSGGEGSMVFDSVFIERSEGHTPVHETVADAADIIAAYKSGKNVVIHFLGSDESRSYLVHDGYLTMIGYRDPFDGYGGHVDMRFDFSMNGNIISNILTDASHARINDNGKLEFDIYVD